LGSPDNPQGHETTLHLPRPRLSVLLIGGNDSSTARNLNQPDSGVDDHVADDTCNQAVRDAVCERHHSQCDEGGEGVAEIAPVDVLRGHGHHGPDNDERAARGPGWDGCKDRREENGDEEADSSRHSCETGLAAFGNSGT